MSETRRRILVSLDPGISSESALQAVGALGPAEIRGLFVEDATLLHLARLSMVSEITMDARRQALAVERVETQFRAQAARLRALLEAEAGRSGLTCDFEVARGEFASELRRAATRAEILVLAHSRLDVARARARRLRLADLLSEGPPTLLFVQERWATGRRIVALAVGADRNGVMRQAAAVALREKLDLTVLAAAGDANRAGFGGPPQSAGLAASRVRLRAIRTLEVLEILRAVTVEDARLVVLPATVAAAEPSLVNELLDRADCSVMIVR